MIGVISRTCDFSTTLRSKNNVIIAARVVGIKKVGGT